MTRKRAFLRGISVVVAIVFFWTNCVWAGGLSSDKLAAQSRLSDVLSRARVVYTGTALHSALITEGIVELMTLYENQEKIKAKLRESIGDVVDGLKTLIFRDEEGGIAYYTFSKDGYFYRFTTKETVDDPFNRLIVDRFTATRSQRIDVPVNGDIYYQEIIETSPKIADLVNTCLNELYPEGDNELKSFRGSGAAQDENLTLAKKNFKDAMNRVNRSRRFTDEQKTELKIILEHIFSEAMPFFEKGAKENPVYHNTQVLDNMVRIGLGENLDYNEFKLAVILALLHDIGNAFCTGKKVKNSEIKAKIKENKLDEAIELAQQAIKFILEHMEKGPEIVRLLTKPLADEGRLSQDDVEIVCAAVKVHDNPSIEKTIKEMRDLGVAMSHNPGDFLFTFDDKPLTRLVGFLREADRLFMVIFQGVVKDLEDKKEEINEANIRNKLASNRDSHREEYGLYKKANRDDGRFLGGSLYRTKTGYAIFEDSVNEVEIKLMANRLVSDGIVSLDEMAEAGKDVKVFILEKIAELIKNQKYDLAAGILQEFSRFFNYLKTEGNFNEILVGKSKIARDLAVLIVNDSALVERIKQGSFESLRIFIEREVASGRMEEGKAHVKLETAIKYINEWLNRANSIPVHIRAGIIRGMLEGRDSDLLFAFGEGWRKFGTAGIRNPAVASEFPAILELELQEFAENPHAPIITGPNMINMVTILQQEAAIAKLFEYLSENIDNSKLSLSEQFKENIRKKKITIAYDSRLNGEYFAKMLACAFLRDGINVDLFDNAAGMPALVYSADRMDSAFGFLISASHSEANYNGFKAVLGHLASQLDASGKDMVMQERAKVTYKDMHLDLAEMTIEGFEEIMSSKNGNLRWLGSSERRSAVNYCNAEFVDFYTGYYAHVARRSPLANLDGTTRKKVEVVKGDMQVFYTAFYGVGAIPAGDFPGFLKQQGYGSVSIVKKQTEKMDGRFEGHYMPDPGVVSGWVVNLLDFLIQEAGVDLKEISGAIEKLNNQEAGVATDPDIDRAGMMLSLPPKTEGNIKKALIKAVDRYLSNRVPKDEKDKVIAELEGKLNDKYLLTANDAWAFMAYYQLKLLEEKGLMRRDRVYFIEESHVTTPALERIAQLFRDKGYRIYVIQTYVGFTELAKKSRDLFTIAEISNNFVKAYQNGLGDKKAETISELIIDLGRAYKELKSNVPSGSNEVEEVGEVIEKLKNVKNETDLRDALLLLEVLSNMEVLYGVEESNGYGEFGRFDPAQGKVVDTHICEKDGSLAAFKFLEIIAYGKLQGQTGYEMFGDMIREIGHINTDNRFLPHPGLKGNDEKEAEVEALEKIFAYVLQRELDNSRPVYLFNGKYKLERVEIYRDGKYDDIYREFPEEGVRLYLKTRQGSDAIVTLRPSGTGDTIRSYAWILGQKPAADINLEDYRRKINTESEELARDFFGDENLQGKEMPPLGYVDQPKEKFYGLLAALKEGGRQRYEEVFAKTMGLNSLPLSKEERDLIGVAGQLAFADRKGKKAGEEIAAKNNDAVESYLASDVAQTYPNENKVDVVISGKKTSIPNAAFNAWRVSFGHYLGEQHPIYTKEEEEWLSILEKSIDELVGDTMRGTKEYKREVKAKLIKQKAALDLLRSKGPKAFLEDERIRRAIDRQGMIDRIRTRLKNLEENIDDTTDGIKEVLNSRFSQEDRYKIKKIKIVGLGGSAAAGELALDVIRTYKGLGYEAEVVRDVRSIKEKIEDDTLVILVSFSGNTDEMINAAEELKRHSSNNPKIIALTGSRGNGGILGRIAGMQGWPHIKLPHTEDIVRGRESIIIQMISILTILSELNLSGGFKIEEIGLKDSLSFLNGQCAGKYNDSIPYERNVAMQMALSLLYGIDYDGEGKPPHLDPYAHRKEPYIIIGEQMRSIGAKFQGELSGHAEVVSSFYTTPEFYHDTIEAVKTAYEQEGESGGKYSMLFLRSEDEYSETRERLEEVIREIFPDGEGRRYQRIAEGDTPFKRILDLFLFTEWVGLYMSLLNGIDPVPQSITEYLVRRIPIAEFKETTVKEETREDRRGFIAKESVESAGEPEDSGLSIFRMPEKIKPKPLNQKEHAILEAHLYEFRHNSYIRSYLDKLKSMGVKIKFAELSDDLVLRIGNELYLDISLLRGKTYEDRIPSILLHSILRYEVYRGSCVNAFTEDEFIEDVAATLAELEELMAIYIGTPEQQILDFWQFTRRRVEILLEQLNPQAAKRLRTKLDLAYLLAKKPGLYQRKTGYSIDGIKEVLRDVLNTKKYKSVKNRLEGKTDELAEKILREREIRILREDLARFRDYHIEELDKREKAWDYIFIAAANEAQAEAFQKELEYRRDILDSFHPHTNVDVIFPPKDQNIGNGGAALYAVRKAAEAIASEKPGKRYKSIEDIFKGKRVLLILSGGDSKRIPIFSATGKAFTTVPTKLETGGAGVSNERKPTSSLFDEIYTMLSGAVTKMDDGMIVIPGDAQMVFDYEHVKLDRPGELDGLVEVVWRILADEGHKRIENHGVRIASKGSEGILVHSAEKLPVGELQKWEKTVRIGDEDLIVKAIGDDSRANLSTALIKLDVDTMARMARLGGLVLENGRPGKEDSLRNTVMAEIPLELYADILPVFGLSMGKDSYVAVKDERMKAAREKIWDVFREPGREVRYHVQSTSPFIFADFGTTKQFQEHLATRDDVNQVYQFPSWLNHFVDMGVDVSEEAKVYDSILLGREGRVQPGAIVIYSKLDKDFDIGRGTIVYGVMDSQGRLKVKDNNVIYQLPVKVDGEETLISVLFGMDDDPKQLLYGEYVAIDNEGKETKRKGSRMRFGSSKTRATLFGRDFLRWLEDIGIAPDEVWDKSVPDDKRSLWNARLYVPGDNDFSLTLWMQEEGTPDKDILSKWREAKRLSMEDIVSPDIIDHTRLFIQRDEIRKDPRILLGGGRLSSFDQKIRDVWEYILENSLKETDRDKRLIKYDPMRFDNSDFSSKELKSRGDSRVGRRGNLIVRYDPRRGEDAKDKEVEVKVVQEVTEGESVFSKLPMKNELLTGPIIVKGNRYRVIANISPIFRYHVLFVSEELRPQVLAEGDIESAIALMRDNRIKLYFNSWGAAASVNHFHLQGSYGYSDEYQPVETDRLPVENAPIEPLFRVCDVKVGCVAEYPAKCLVFEADEEVSLSRVFYDFVRFLQREDVNVPHNVLFTHNKIFIFLKATRDRKTITTGIDINPAAPELAGIITVKTSGFKDKLPTLEDLQGALRDATVSEDELKGLLSRYLSILQKKESYFFLMDREITRLGLLAKSSDNNTRLEAIRKLAHINNPFAVDVLIEALRDRFYAVYLEAARGLGEIKNKKAVAPLVEVLNSREGGRLLLKREAAISLGKIRDGKAIEALEKVIRDCPYEIVRKASAWALGEIGGKDAFRILLKALETEKSALVRREIALAIVKTGIEAQGKIEQVKRMFNKEPDWQVRKAMVRVLFNLGDKDLSGLETGQDIEVRAEVLRVRTGKTHLDTIGVVQKHWHGEVQNSLEHARLYSPKIDVYLPDEEFIEGEDKVGLIEELWDREGYWEQFEQRSERLGWLRASYDMTQTELTELMEFGEEAREKYEYVVIMGMGGATQGIYTYLNRFGFKVDEKGFWSKEGYPKFYILDTSSPGARETLDAELVLDKTLFIYSSKAGGAPEPAGNFEYFYKKTFKGDKKGHFVIITDPDFPLDNEAKSKGLRVFHSMVNIGGRFTALSTEMLVPAVIMGVDIDNLLRRVRDYTIPQLRCYIRFEDNPAVRLAVTLDELRKKGRNKITLVSKGNLEQFAPWLEQLLAESLGKGGRGIVPISGEELSDTDVYRDDRVFIYIANKSEEGEDVEKKLELLQSRHPVVRITVPDNPEAVGELFFIFEMCTAILGRLMQINPFDEPGVIASKQKAGQILKKGTPERNGEYQITKGAITIDYAAVMQAENAISEDELSSALRRLGETKDDIAAVYAALLYLIQGKGIEYAALLPYIRGNKEEAVIWNNWRSNLRQITKMATFFGEGPRYQHSALQLFQDGPNTGFFTLLGEDNDEEGNKLIKAQRWGTLEALQEAGRMVVNVSVPKLNETSRRQLAEFFENSFSMLAQLKDGLIGGGESEVLFRVLESLFLQNEFGKVSERDRETINSIVQILTEEIDSNPDRHIIEILKKVCGRHSAIRELVEKIKGRPLKELRQNLAYQALVQIVRNWPKKDWHCHVSDSLDDKFCLEQIEKKVRRGEKVGALLGRLEKSLEAKVDPRYMEKDKKKKDEIMKIVRDYFYRHRLENPYGNTLKDEWIEDIEDFVSAVRYVVRQYFEDGVTTFELRFNPFKEFYDEEDRIAGIEEVIREVAKAVAEEEEAAKKKYGKNYHVRFMFSLNRDKYGSVDPKKHFIPKILDALCEIKRDPRNRQLAERMYGIDMSGLEMPEWECDGDGNILGKGKEMFSKLREAHAAEFEIVSHLGHTTNVDERFKINIDDDEKTIKSKLKNRFRYINYYIENGVVRIGHGSIIRPRIIFGDKEVDLESIGLMQELNELMGNIVKNRVEIERCASRVKSFQEEELEHKVLVYSWQENNIDFRLGVDGLNKSISLSQWIVMILLAAPTTRDWTVKYLRDKVGSASEAETYGSHIVQEVEKAEQGAREETIHAMKLNKMRELEDITEMPQGVEVKKNMLSDAMKALAKKYEGLGIFMVTDQVEIVRNLRAHLYRQGRAPLAVYVTKGGVRKLKIDERAFIHHRLLYEELEHEFSESVARVVPGSNPAISDVVATVINVRGFLGSSVQEQNEFLGILGQNKRLDPDGEYKNLLNRLRGTKGLSDNELIASVVRYVLRTKLYQHMREEFGLPDELAARIKDLEHRVDDALAVFNEIKKATQGEKLVERIKETEKLAISVVKTFNGAVSIKGLERLNQRLAGVVAGLVKVASNMYRLRAKISEVKTDQKYCIVVDTGSIPAEMRADWEKEKDVLQKGQIFTIVSSVEDARGKGFSGKQIIYLIDIHGLQNMERHEDILYLPMPYIRSSLYMAALVVVAGGDVDSLNKEYPIITGLIGDLYSQILGRRLEEAELRDFLGRLFTAPWLILPEIQSVLNEINYLPFIAQAERAA